jgi:hypothetical protein
MLSRRTLQGISIVVLCLWLAGAQAYAAGCGMLLCGAGSSGGGGGGGGASYSLAGSIGSTGSGGNVSGALNVGTAAANRVIVVASATQANGTMTAVTVNGVSCTVDTTVGNAVGSVGVASCPGASYGSGSQTIAVTWSAGSFNGRGFSAWVCSNMTSTTVQGHNSAGGASSTTVAVTAGDFLFAANPASAPSWASSTQSPSNTQSNIGTAAVSTADWTIASTNASFSVAVNNGNSVGAAGYH